MHSRPGQHERHVAGNQRETVQQQKDKTYSGAIFFIKYRVRNGDITLKHCPTGEVLADHFTKPLQGALFCKFRAEIQGIPLDTYEAELGWDRVESCEEVGKVDPSPQECVELSQKGFLRSKNTGLRGEYLQALHYKGRLDDPSESALEVASSGERRKDTVRKDTLRSAPSLQWSKEVSYAQVLTGKNSTTESP
jgi:hypothetical protein